MHTTSTGRILAGAFLVIAAIANFAGYYWPLYKAFSWFDKVLHGYTIFSLTLPAALFLSSRVLKGHHTHRFLLVLTAASVGLAIGALWEVAEWAFELSTEANIIKGKFDTITDIIADTGGALIAGWLLLGLTEEKDSAASH